MFVTISLLLAAACLLPAAGKLLGHPKMRQSAAHFGIPWPRYRLIGAAEHLGHELVLRLQARPPAAELKPRSAHCYRHQRAPQPVRAMVR